PAQNTGPMRMRYILQAIELHKRVDNLWLPVGRKAAMQDSNAPPDSDWVPSPNPLGVPELFGSWAAVPAIPHGGGENVGQTKLWLWSKTPFDYTRHTGREWDEWFTDHFNEYPCVPIPPDREICCDFEKISPIVQLRPPWPCPDQPDVVLSWLTPEVQNVTVLAPPVEGFTHALCLPGTLTSPAQIHPFPHTT